MNNPLSVINIQKREVKGQDQGHDQGHVTYFLNFGTPVTFERVKLDTSFFLCWIGPGG